MIWLKNVGRWFSDYWFLLLLLLGGLVAFAWKMGKSSNPFEVVKKEKEIIDAKAKVRKEKAAKGVEAAKKMAREEYLAQLDAIDKARVQKYEELIDDPEALVDAVLRRAFDTADSGSSTRPPE